QFKIQKVWTLVDYPKGVRPIGTKWVLKNKKDEKGIVVRNKVRLVAQWHTQEEGIDYDEVFAPVARIEAISLFLAYASFMGFTVYQMDVKSAFLYGTIDEEVYVMQPPRFHDPVYPAKIENFIPIGSKEESKRLKRRGLNLEKEQVKKQKSSEEPPEIETTTKEFTEDKIKEIMQLVPVEDVYVQALQVKHPIVD
nr:putative ribonuclease H-like domain-containing protein [Tanacetum cinerariifolium]